jgi:hypothetical protein
MTFGARNGETTVNSKYQTSQNASSAKPKLVKPKANVRLGGTLPTEGMAPGKYLVLCEGAWLQPVSKQTQEHKAVFQFRIIDGKFDGVALRMWIDKAADAGGIISPVGKYARHCEIALGRPLEESDPVDEPRQIFFGRRFLVFVGYRKSEHPRGRGRQSDDLAVFRKDDADYLRAHGILSLEDDLQ